MAPEGGMRPELVGELQREFTDALLRAESDLAEETLREAVDAGAAVVIGYVDHHGTRSDRLVRPRRIESGQLVALDLRADDTRTFPIHRITTVTAVETRS